MPAAEARLELRHLRREIKTALELAIVALAPADLLDPLATAAGLLEAVCELPADSAPAIALTPKLLERARRSLDEWRRWEQQHVHKGLA
jgi:hypothetical protein